MTRPRAGGGRGRRCVPCNDTGYVTNRIINVVNGDEVTRNRMVCIACILWRRPLPRPRSPQEKGRMRE